MGMQEIVYGNGSHFLGMFMRNVLSVWYEVRNVIPQS